MIYLPLIAGFGWGLKYCFLVAENFCKVFFGEFGSGCGFIHQV